MAERFMASPGEVSHQKGPDFTMPVARSTGTLG